MTDPAPRAGGWYPDPQTGGSRYSDGKRWTGDVRPPRKPFAASSKNSALGICGIVLGLTFPLMGIGALTEGETSGSPNVGLFVGMLVIGVLGIAAGIYALRGQGPSTEEVRARLVAEEKEAKAKRRAANVAGIAASLTGRRRSEGKPVEASAALAEAAQIDALSDPATASALQNLQNLLYTRAITDAEYQAAKDKLFRPMVPSDTVAHIQKLAELHEAGILGDIEFAAAKAKALGI